MGDPEVKNEVSTAPDDDDVVMEDVAEPPPAAPETDKPTTTTKPRSQSKDDGEQGEKDKKAEGEKEQEPEQEPEPEAGKESAPAAPENPPPKDGGGGGVKLEDLFADMESDDEFPTASRRPAKANGGASNDNDQDGDHGDHGDDDDDDENSTQYGSSPPPEAESSVAAFSRRGGGGGGPGDVTDMKASDPEIMRTFYQRLFPWRHLFQWLNHGLKPSNDFGHREFAFTLQNDAYLRYQSFPSHDLLRKDILRLMPSRFEIGPIYTLNPRDRKTVPTAFKPLAKELCFDIDLTDYDDIRTCCSGASICLSCWSFMTMAIRVLDVALRDDFGFRHVLWVYSGRRGAHAWVCDRSARSLDDARRRAVAGYLEVVRGGAQSGKKVNLRPRPLHPHLSRSLELLKPHFQDDVLPVQDPWRSPDQAEKLLRLLPDPTLNDSLRRKWDAAPGRSSAAKWNDIDAVAKTGASKKLDTRTLLEAKQDVVLEYTYPRLDIEVSKKLNHLLKSPFVVHPGTGRVCVPIDPRHLEDFDPLQVPTVQKLIKEIDEWKEEGGDGDDAANGEGGGGGGGKGGGKPMQDWKKTSLKPYIDYFHSFVHALNRDERENNVKVKREREEPVPGSDAMEF